MVKKKKVSLGKGEDQKIDPYQSVLILFNQK